MAETINKRRVVKNTFMLYFRQILILFVSLYSVRIVLSSLGAQDYGIYNVVAGIVTSFSFLSTAMAAATQRFFSFNLGQNSYSALQKTFCVIIEIYILLIFIVVVAAETFGIWLVHHKLVIPSERMSAAVFVFQFATLAFSANLFSTPFLALIIAHEDMNVYAYVSVTEALLKLSAVFLLQISKSDRLILYGMLLAVVSVIVAILYIAWCKIKYSESAFHFLWERKIFIEIASFSGWCLFGSSAGVAKNQLSNVLINIFFGPEVNAARAIAYNVNNAVISFAANFNTAVRPQIIKSYSIGDKNSTFELVFQSTKLSYFLLWIFMCPLFLEIDFVLELWLKNVPDMTVVFTQLILIECMCDSISYPMQSLSQASGKMKLYQSVVGGILLLNFPISYIVLKNGVSAYAVQYIAILIAFTALILRIAINKILTGLNISCFFAHAILPCVLVSVLSCVPPFLIHHFMSDGFLRLVFVVLVSTICTALFSYSLAISKYERIKIREVVSERFVRRKNGE